MDRHGQIRNAHEDASKRDRKEDVEIAKEYARYRSTFIKILGEFEITSDGHLGRIDVVEHRMDLEISGERPNRSMPYRAGPRARYFENKKSSGCAPRQDRSNSNRIVCSNSFCPKEIWLKPFLRRLSKTECRYSKRLISNTTKGRLYRIFRRCTVFAALGSNSC